MNRLTFLLYLALAPLLTVHTSAQGPAYIWGLTSGGTGSDDGRVLDTDGVGNIYVAGTFSGGMDLDPGPASQLVSSNGAEDIFIQKFDPSGNLPWAGKIGGTGEDVVRDIHIDGTDILLAGRFELNVDFDPGPGIMSINATATRDAFLLRLQNNGTVQWVHHVGDAGWSDGRAIATDDTGNIYFTGSFQADPDFDPGPSTDVISSLGYSEIFVQKLSATGNHIWVRANQGAQPDNGRWVTIDGSGDIILGGRFQSTTDFDPGPGVQMLASNGDGDGYIQKLDGNGNLIWVGQIGGTGEDMAYHHATDLAGNTYVTGWFSGTADLDPGAGVDNHISSGDRDIMIVKVDPNGDLVWARSLGGPGEDLARSVTVDGQQRVYMTGRFNNTVDFDPGAGVVNLSSNGDADAFYLVLDANGDYLWASNVGGTGFDDGYEMHIDPFGAIYTTGGFSNVVDLDPGIGVENVTSIGQDDVYLTKLEGIVASVNDAHSGPSVSIYPNPVRDMLTIELDELHADIQVIISDQSGRTMRRDRYRSSDRLEISLPDAAGLYHLQLIIDGGSTQSVRVMRY